MTTRHALLVATVLLAGTALVVASPALASPGAASPAVASAGAASPGVASPAVAGQADDGPDLDVDDAVDVPEREVEHEGETYTVERVLAVDPGEPFAVAVTGADEATLDLRNADEDVEASRRLHPEPHLSQCDDGTCTFQDDASYPVGTYALALEADGAYRTIQPVVVEGYDLAVDAPAEVERGGTATVTVDVGYAARESSPADVAVALHHDGTVVDGEATEAEAIDGGDRYRVDVDVGDAPTGTYDVYAAARSDESVDGSPTALAVDGSATVEVVEGADGSGGETGDDAGGLPAGHGGDADDAGEPAGEDAAGDDSSEDEEPSGEDADGDDSEGAGEAGETGDPGADGAASKDGGDGDDGAEDGVIEPEDESSDDGAADETDETPGFGVLAVLSAVLVVAGRAAFDGR